MQSATNAPVLATERLRLRAHRVDDLPQCAAMWAEEGVTRFIGGKPLTEEETCLRMLRHAGHWSLLDFGYWVVEEKTTGQFLGEDGLAEFRREIEFLRSCLITRHLNRSHAALPRGGVERPPHFVFLLAFAGVLNLKTSKRRGYYTDP